MIAYRILPALLVFALAFAFLPAQREGSGPVRKGSTPLDAAKPKLALKGLDPVLLAQDEEEKGKGDLILTHEGFVYHFASPATRSAFTANPHKYAVQDKGLCPVAKVKMNREIPGDPEIYSVHQGMIYLLANQDAKRMFDENPSEFVPQRETHPDTKILR